MSKRTVVMSRDEVVEAYGLCATCANREACEDKPEDMVLDLCSSYDDCKATEYKVTVSE